MDCIATEQACNGAKNSVVTDEVHKTHQLIPDLMDK
jgi:hypothetical protein